MQLDYISMYRAKTQEKTEFTMSLNILVKKPELHGLNDYIQNHSLPLLKTCTSCFPQWLKVPAGQRRSAE